MSNLHVLFKVAGAEYALPAEQVLHMETFTEATRVPGSAPHVTGLMQIRQRVVPIVDLRARFGLPKVETTDDRRVVVVQDGERTVGLLVDSAREVLDIPREKFQAPPDVLAKESRGFVKSVAQTGKRLVLLLDFKKVVGEESHG